MATAIRNNGGRAGARACHVGHWEKLEPLVESIYAEFGRIDVLVNNAGSSPLYGKLSDISEELWDKTIALNLRGPFPAVRARGRADGGGGRWIDHQRVERGRGTPHARHRPLRRRQGGPQRDARIALAEAFGPNISA